MGYKDLMDQEVEEVENNVPDPEEKISEEVAERVSELTYRIGETVNNYKKAEHNFDDLSERMLTFLLSGIVNYRKMESLRREGFGRDEQTLKQSKTIIEVGSKEHLLSDFMSRCRKSIGIIRDIIEVVIDDRDRFLPDDVVDKMEDRVDGRIQMYDDFLSLKEEFNGCEMNHPHFFYTKSRGKINELEDKYYGITNKEYEFRVRRDDIYASVSSVSIEIRGSNNPNNIDRFTGLSP